MKTRDFSVLPSEYKIGIVAVDIFPEKSANDELFFALKTSSFATETLKQHIVDTLQASPYEEKWIDFGRFEGKELRDIKKGFQEELDSLSKEHTGKTIFIGISLLGHYLRLKYFADTLLEAKKKNPNFVFLLGGANFSKVPEKDCIELLKGYGIDLLSVGGGETITEFLESVGKEKSLFRDEEGTLQVGEEVTLPNNFLLTTQTDEKTLSHVVAGKHVKPKPFLEGDQLHYSFYHTCKNSCNYCSGNRMDFGKTKVEDSIAEINSVLESCPEAIHLNLQDLNPLQGNIDHFMRFLEGLHWEKIKGIGIFGDFMSLSTEVGLRKAEKFLKFFRYGALQDKSVGIWMAMDSVKFEGDGEFLGRKHGNKVFGQEGHENALSGFYDLIEVYATEKIKFHTSFIMHPGMNLACFNEKLQLMNTLHDTGVQQIADYTLKVHPNTQMEKDYHQYVLPQYHLHTSQVHEEYASQWSVFYENSPLLDVYSYLGSLECGIPDKILVFHLMKMSLEGADPASLEKLGDRGTSLMLAMEFFEREKYIVLKKKDMDRAAKFITYFHFLIERETFILDNFPEHVEKKKYIARRAFVRGLEKEFSDFVTQLTSES